MVHRREIKEECWHPDCTATARWEVFDSRGKNYGNYCLHHAKMKEVAVAELEAAREELDEEDNNVREG